MLRALLAGFHGLEPRRLGSADMAGRQGQVSCFILKWLCCCGFAEVALLMWRPTCTKMLAVLLVRFGRRGPLSSVAVFYCGSYRLPLPDLACSGCRFGLQFGCTKVSIVGSATLHLKSVVIQITPTSSWAEVVQSNGITHSTPLKYYPPQSLDGDAVSISSPPAEVILQSQDIWGATLVG
ncbi:hypothetical protein Nepgr_013453 [Nepenthes gracilis]|uniref:Uncharacterized protein n=1 Tax=Nepenthes gracilis TaxID=150966 RepID=A0AAD3SJ66_NEPGR|nr:hypothetical protein Nepgr_013453 [Nepenthes gracilis]